MKKMLIEKARLLRKQGYSYLEIARSLNISKDTAHRWTKDVLLDSDAQARIQQRLISGRQRSTQIRILNNRAIIDRIHQEAESSLTLYQRSDLSEKILCALIYWCEGSKTKSLVGFTNSDPQLIRLFLCLLRKSFTLDERKFRVVVHIHDYHDDDTQKSFWSNVTNVPVCQFTKSYLKQHTGKVRRQDYQGCISVRYYDALIAKQLQALAIAYMQRGVG